jgi:hypothetical protein
MLRTPLALTAALLLARTAGAVDVTTCGQSVPRGETGALTGDLDCSTLSDGAAVMLGQRAVLVMNGFTLRAGFLAVSCENAKCSVQGPGEIIGGGVEADRGLVLTDVYIHDTGVGVKAYRGILSMTNVTVSDVSVGEFGVVAGNIRANNVTVTRSGLFGLWGSRSVRGTAVTVTDNGWSGVFSRRIVLDGLVAHGNGVGPIFNSYGAGVQASRSATLLNSVVTGNKFLGADLDVLTVKRPVLSGTTCDHSGQGDGSAGVPVATWGVCSLD